MQICSEYDNDYKNEDECNGNILKDKSISSEKSVIASSNFDDNDSCKNNNELSQEIMLNYMTTKNCDSSIDGSYHNDSEDNHNISRQLRRRGNPQKDKRLKTNEEIAILEAYFKLDPAWGRRTVKELKTQLPTLTVDQIYKWGYDRKLLLKKQIAKQRAKLDLEANNKLEIDLQQLTCSISDYNKEVENLCNFQLTSTNNTENEANDGKISIAARKSRFRKHAVSLNSKETLLTTEQKELLTADDPYFYSSTDDSFFYYVNKDSKNTIPHRVVGKRGLFRIPSGFFNLDFYTYKEEAFKDGAPEFLYELKGAEI